MTEQSFFVKPSSDGGIYKINKPKLLTELLRQCGGGAVTRRNTKTLWVFEDRLWREWDFTAFGAWVHAQSITHGCAGQVTPFLNPIYEWVKAATLDQAYKEYGDNGIFEVMADEHSHILPTRGLYINLETMKKVEPKAEYYKTSCLPMLVTEDDDLGSYNCPLFEGMLETAYQGDKASIGLVKEIMGYCLLGDCRMEKVFVFIGEGGTGKTQILEVIHCMLNGRPGVHPNTSSIGAAELAESFALSGLVGKYANICDETPKHIMAAIQRIKSIASGSTMNVNPKGKAAYSAALTAKLIFSMNETPYWGEDNEAIDRRMVYLGHNFMINKSEKKVLRYARKVFKKEAKEIFKFALCGARELLLKQSFTIPADSVALAEDIRMENSPVRQWLEANVVINPIMIPIPGFGALDADASFLSCASLVQNFNSWRQKNDIKKSFGPKQLVKEVAKVVGLERKFKQLDMGQIVWGFRGLRWVNAADALRDSRSF